MSTDADVWDVWEFDVREQVSECSPRMMTPVDVVCVSVWKRPFDF